MSKIINVGSKSFELPTQGQEATWGEALSDIIEEMANVINNAFGPEDIRETSQAILNNQATPINVPGFIFDSTVTRSFDSSYNVTRNVNISFDTISDDGAGEILITGNPHYLNVGNSVVISDTAGYDGSYTVNTTPTEDSFTITAAFVATETGTITNALVESGRIIGNYSPNNSWIISVYMAGLTGIELSITNSGQIQYTTTDIISTSHVGLIKFKANTILKV